MGHLICAQEAYVQLELDVVVFVPVARSPHREIHADPGAEVRLTMCEHAVAGRRRRDDDCLPPSQYADLGGAARQAVAGYGGDGAVTA